MLNTTPYIPNPLHPSIFSNSLHLREIFQRHSPALPDPAKSSVASGSLQGPPAGEGLFRCFQGKRIPLPQIASDRTRVWCTSGSSLYQLLRLRAGEGVGAAP